MNYLAHGIAFLDQPEFMAGTAIPDWLSVADRPVRVRSRLVEQFLYQQHSTGVELSEAVCQIALGARQHLLDDEWFHGQRAFVEVSTQLGKHFREVFGPDDNFRAGFLGHIVTEMLLDRWLMKQQPELLERYYKQLAQIDAAVIEETVNAIATRPTNRLANLIERFVEERFLFDYLSYQKMLFRLNQVMRRVKLPELSEAIVPVLTAGAQLVAERHQELLPAHVLVALRSPAKSVA